MKTLEKYTAEIKHLSYVIPGFHKLDKHQKQSAQNDTLIKFIQKIEQGVIENSDDYEAYKNYMFISLKNHINRNFERDASKKAQERLRVSSIEDEDFIEPFNPYQLNSNWKDVLMTLNPKERAYINFIYKYNWKKKQLARALGIPFSSFDDILERIYEKIKRRIVIY